MSGVVRKIAVPWPLIAILVVLAAAAWIQGLRAASSRHTRLQPARATQVDASTVATISTDGRFVTVDFGNDPPARLGLYQILPSRPLIRWIEPAGSTPDPSLVIPLEGLGPGDYAVCAVDPATEAGPVEMDVPVQQLDVRARFALSKAP